MLTYKTSPYNNTHSALYRCITYMEDSIMERHLAPQAAPSSSASAAAIERDRVTSLFVSRTIPPILSTWLCSTLSIMLLSRHHLFVVLWFLTPQPYITHPCYPILSYSATSRHVLLPPCWHALLFLHSTTLSTSPFLHDTSLNIFNSYTAGLPLRVGPVPYGGQRLHPPGHTTSLLYFVLYWLVLSLDICW